MYEKIKEPAISTLINKYRTDIIDHGNTLAALDNVNCYNIIDNNHLILYNDNIQNNNIKKNDIK